MNDFTKTGAFAGFAIALLALAGWTWKNNQPPKDSGYTDQGTPFFEELEAGTAVAESMEVYGLDENGLMQEFMIHKKDGLWTIPSHYNYPAEAADRLGNVTSSLLGMIRQGVDTRSSSDHEKRGVLDPLDPENRDPELTGQRIILKGAGDVTLADLIIGQDAGEVVESEADLAFGERGRKRLHFVRVADETTVYRVPLKLELSTQFSDWINTDLLEPGEALPLELSVKSRASETDARSPEAVTEFSFSRSDPASPWSTEGLKAETESVRQPAVNALFFNVDLLAIRGVRPKATWKGEQMITADLEVNRDPALMSDPASFQQAIVGLQRELAAVGFALLPSRKSGQELELVSEFGEMSIGLNDGLRYTIHFGREIKGDEQSIEIGDAKAELSESGGDGAESDSSLAAGDSAKDEADEPGDTKDDPGEGLTPNRFAMIRVVFDQSLLGSAPEKPALPVAPAAPEGYVPGAKPAADNSGEANSEAAQETERDPAFVEYEKNLAEFEQLKAKHELDLVRFDTESKAWEKRNEVAKKRVGELNDRFGKWYYVVSGSNLEKLSPAREDLVETKEPDPANAPLPPVPDIQFEGDESPDDAVVPEGVESDGESGAKSN